ncbi:MAG: agmatine deiminase family protein [Anaerolineae bacterium]|nr:agmatine deiminase family protein [Anaerolineae bacterium]
MLRFNYVPYPLWRRYLPAPLGLLTRPLWRWLYPADAEIHPPATARQMARFMARWGLLGEMSEEDARRRMAEHPTTVEMTRGDALPQPAPSRLIRLPAQWEPMEAIILTWPVYYPPLWPLYASMVEAIAPVARVTINIARPTFANGVELYLMQHSTSDLKQVQFLYMPTDDIWVRDYGPIVGLDESGQQVVVHATYDPLPHYPQSQDNAMPTRWAAHHEIPVRALDLHAEGGNIWSDGAGTLLMSDEFQRRDSSLTVDSMLAALHKVFLFDKLIVTPHLQEEETGHIDLLVKLAGTQTVLVTEPGDSLNTERLRQTGELLRQETNARGYPYQVFELPALPQYFNWGLFSIWRSYTNSLTVNGRVLVPIYGESTDERALEIYQQAMPDYTIIPINCKVGINGGGAVHCMTKEVPRAGNHHSKDETS